MDVVTAVTSFAKMHARFEDRRMALVNLAEYTRSVTQPCTTTPSLIHSSWRICSSKVASGTRRWSSTNILSAHRKAVYGPRSLPVAKTVNDFAVVLAKHGKLSEVLQRYEISRGIHEDLSSNEYNVHQGPNDNNNGNNRNQSPNNNNIKTEQTLPPTPAISHST